MSSKVPKPGLDLYRSYLAAIRNSAGTTLFRSLYYRIGGKSIDVLDNGDLSCAVFISSILYLFGLIREVHTTVKKTVSDMERSGWQKIRKPRQGAIIHWSFMTRDDGTQSKHHHLGFYLSAKTAVSNDWETRTIATHHPTYGTLDNGQPRRKIIAYYWNKKLG